MDDRRLRPRVPIEMELEIENGTAWKKIERTRDLSMGGVQVCSDIELPLDSVVKIRFLLDSEHDTTSMTLGAKVKRCESLEPGHWCLGLSFDQLDSDTSIFLYKLIQYHRE